MATEPHTHPEQPRENVREREVIVTNDGGGRSGGMSGVLVALIAIVVLAIVGILVVNAIGGAADDVGSSVPDDVNVDINPGGSGGE